MSDHENHDALMREVERLRHENAMLKTKIDELRGSSSLSGDSIPLTRDMVSCLPAWLFETDRELRIRSCSGQIESILGFTAEELTGQSLLAIALPDYRSTLDRLIRDAMQRGAAPTTVEFWGRARDGKKVYLQLCGVSLGHQGEPARGFRGMGVDLTALLHSEEMFRAYVEQSPFPIMVFSPAGSMIGINEANLRLWGISRETAFRYNILDDPQLEALGIMPHVRRALEGECVTIPPVEYDLQATLGEGFRKVVRGELFPVRDEKGAVLSLIVAHHDVTEQARAEQALRESESRLRVLFSESPDAYLILSDGIVTDCNRAAEIMLGGERRHIVGKRPEVLSPKIQPDGSLSAEAVNRRIAEAIRTGGMVFEWMHRRVDGSEFPAEVAVSPMTLGGETVLLAALRDITGRKRAEAALEESRRELDSLIRNMPDILYRVDTKGTITFINEAVRQYGYAPESLIGTSLFDYVSPEDRNRVKHALNERRTGNRRTSNFEVILFTQNREEVPFDLKNNPVPVFLLEAEGLYADTAPGEHCWLGTQGIARDITERKQAERELRASEERFRNLFDMVPFTCVLTDLNGRFVLANKAFTDYSGYRLEEIMGRSLNDLGMFQDEEARQESVRQLEGTGEVKGLEMRVRMQSAGEYTGLLSSRTIVTEQGPLILSVLVDISERKRAEELLRQSEEKLSRVFQIVPNAISISRLEDGMMLDVNPAMESLLRYPKAKTVGRSSLELGLWPDKTARDALREDLLDRGEVIQREQAMFRPDGTSFITLYSARIVEMDGETCMVSVLEDITERKREEQERHKRTELIRRQGDLFVDLMLGQNVLSLDFQQAASRITEAGAALLGVERVSVWMYEEDQRIIRCLDLYQQSRKTHRSGEILRSELFPAYTQHHRKGKVIAATDVYSDPRTREIPAPYLRENRIYSVLDAPVLVEGAIGGILSFEAVDAPRVWTLDEERAVTMLATLISLCWEIGERKRAEAYLRQSERRLSLAISATSDAVWEWNLKTGNTFYSPRWYEMLGYADTQFPMTLDTWKSLCHPDDIEPTLAQIQAIIQNPGQKGYQAEFRMRTRDGSWIWILGRGNVVEHDRENQPLLISGTNTDITGRKVAEEALRTSEQKYRTILEQNSDGFVLVNAEGRIIEWNHSQEKMSGLTRQEVAGKPFWEIQLQLSRPENRTDMNAERFKEVLLHMIQTGESELFGHTIEYSTLTKEGKARYGEQTVFPVRTDQGIMIGSFTRDVTERKYLEQQYFQSQKMEVIGHLAGGVAHDFNNILTVINLTADLSLATLDPGNPCNEAFEQIRKSGERAANLTRQLLAFSRRQTIEPRIISLNQTLMEMDKMLRRLINENIEMTTLLADDLWTVRVDPGQVEQVLTNLVVNARDAMPAGGKLTIETQNVLLDSEYAESHPGIASGRYVLFCVSDTGVGMSPEVRERAFEPFFTTKPKESGTGLGLSTCYGIVKQNNGGIGIYSEPGRGTSVKVYLPASDSRVEENRRGEIGSVRGTETVLLVEDDSGLRNLVKLLLGEAGYHVLTASNGSEALALARTEAAPIHLLVTDVVMPLMGGRELSDRLHEARPGIRTLYMSGYTDNSIVHFGILDEGVMFIQKPFTPVDFLRKVRGTLE